MDGRIWCEEARRYVANFLSVHRVRPPDEASEDGNIDDIVSDAELQLSPEELSDALATRIGGRERKGDAEDKEACQGGPSHYNNSRSAMELAQGVWHMANSAAGRNAPQFVAPADLETILAGASASQRRERSIAHVLKDTL